jgi:acyl-coenzyme A thioesterase PaaI-like protein
MKVSENTLKWAMCFYPPMLFQRIWVKKIHKNFRGVDIKINRSVFTSNLGNAIFGGTIFAASDPFYALLFAQIMQRKNLKVTVWLKSAEINYLKPGRSDLFYTIRISDEMIAEVEQALQNQGKFVKAYPIDIYDAQGELCATVLNEVYLRSLK